MYSITQNPTVALDLARSLQAERIAHTSWLRRASEGKAPREGRWVRPQLPQLFARGSVVTP